jgi:hypothetical protein
VARIIRASLRGERAKLGDVQARDFADLIIGIERTLAKACGHIVGRRVKSRGRRERLIETATRLRLVAVEAGSVVGVLELPELRQADEEELGLTAENLSELALDRTLDAASGNVNGYKDVVRSLVQLTEELGVGTRYDALVLEEESRTKNHPRREVILDLRHREELRRKVEPEARSESARLAGVLMEADFEQHTARLRTAAKHAIEVRFDDALADQIQEALRQEAAFEGEVTYDRETMTAKTVRLREIARADQLVLGSHPDEFWESRSVGQLAVEQGVSRAQSLTALKDHDTTPDEIDAFFAALKNEGG